MYVYIIIVNADIGLQRDTLLVNTDEGGREGMKEGRREGKKEERKE